MRVFFSGLALLVVLAVLGYAAMKQLKALSPPAAQGVLSSGASGASAAPVQARAVQEQIKLDVNKAIEQGAARNEEVTP